MNIRLPLGIAAGIVVLGSTASAVAPEVALQSGKATFEISGVVPVMCRASVDSTSLPLVAGRIDMGSLHEFCNNPAGYRVVADYSRNLAGAKLYVDGRAIELGTQGSVIVSGADSAAIASHAIELELPATAQAGMISFRVETR